MNDQPITFQSALGKAIALWKSGNRISMVLAAELMAEGYDLPALERVYRK